MKNYYRVMLGRGSSFATKCREEGFFGGHWDFSESIEQYLVDDMRTFNRSCIPIFLNNHPGKSKVAAALACGMLHTICKSIKVGDIVVSPNGSGQYFIGEVSGDYHFVPGEVLPHRRAIKWLDMVIERADMTEGLRNSTGAIGTVANVSKHHQELESFIAGIPAVTLRTDDETVEDPSIFAMEKHLEEILISNCSSFELSKKYDLFSEDDQIVAQQYPTDTGPIDIFAILKDRREILVLELKKGRASDTVVGQILRYIGYVKEELAEPNQTVKGVIIALDDDLRLKRALSVVKGVEFYRYKVSFKLERVEI